jgi:hypothetical protein
MRARGVQCVLLWVLDSGGRKRQETGRRRESEKSRIDREKKQTNNPNKPRHDALWFECLPTCLPLLFWSYIAPPLVMSDLEKL